METEEPREDVGTTYRFPISFQEGSAWEDCPVVGLSRKWDLKSQIGVCGVKMACVPPSGTERTLCKTFQRTNGS